MKVLTSEKNLNCTYIIQAPEEAVAKVLDSIFFSWRVEQSLARQDSISYRTNKLILFSIFYEYSVSLWLEITAGG